MKVKTKIKRHIKKAKAPAAQAKRHVAKLARKKVVKKRTGQRLLRAFFILVASVSTGSLAFTITTTRPTVEVQVRTNVAKAVAQLNPSVTQRSADQTGQASWYAVGLPEPDALTCASTTFPRGTYLLVTNLRNGKSVICLVNDYGPEAWTHRAIDLSRGSFRVIDDLGSGTAPVEIRVVPAPPSSINLPFPSTFTVTVGYSFCDASFSSQFCEDNRTRDNLK